ncbi:MAG: CRISPR-associated protein Cas4, partial [Candidatus Natronoplasma sp.]
MDEEWISASDIEKFGYCPLSWWLSRTKEEEPEDEKLDKGEEKHKEIGEALKDVQKKEKDLKLVENIILVLAISATVTSIVGLTFLYTEDVFSRIFIALSLIWLLAATFFLFMSERHD